MKLIVGLGNPGRGYASNRHNVGFMCLNYFARTQGIRFDKKQGKARIGTGEVDSNQIVLAKPQTYMNLSGESVSRLVKKFAIDPNDLLVVHDDLDLPLGKIRIRGNTGSGGHKGVGSIISSLGRQDFSRLRIGIGRPITAGSAGQMDEADTVSYVLSDFTPEENKNIIRIIPRASQAILCFLTEGLTSAMNTFN